MRGNGGESRCGPASTPQPTIEAKHTLLTINIYVQPTVLGVATAEALVSSWASHSLRKSVLSGMGLLFVLEDSIAPRVEKSWAFGNSVGAGRELL